MVYYYYCYDNDDHNDDDDEDQDYSAVTCARARAHTQIHTHTVYHQLPHNSPPLPAPDAVTPTSYFRRLHLKSRPAGRTVMLAGFAVMFSASVVTPVPRPFAHLSLRCYHCLSVAQWRTAQGSIYHVRCYSDSDKWRHPKSTAIAERFRL